MRRGCWHNYMSLFVKYFYSSDVFSKTLASLASNPVFMKKITILFVDDHRLFREAFTDILKSEDRFLVIGETSSGAEAIEMAKTLNPDIVLMDILMSPVDGFEATRQICMNTPARVIALTFSNALVSVKRLLDLGAMGYLTKDSSKEEMMSAIIEVSSDKKYICKDIKNALSRQQFDDNDQYSLVNSLTKREIEIVQNVKKGFSSREIALQLDVGVKTVETHRHNILKKLHLSNSASLINFFNVNGL